MTQCVVVWWWWWWWWAAETFGEEKGVLCGGEGRGASPPESESEITFSQQPVECVCVCVLGGWKIAIGNLAAVGGEFVLF